MRKVFEGLQILIKYDPDGTCQAEHDEIFACDVAPGQMTVEDVDKLKELGWRWDGKLPSWCKFV